MNRLKLVRSMASVAAWIFLLHNGFHSTLRAQTPGADALVAAYGFSEGSGAITADSSGNLLNGTLTGATWAGTGKYGSAIAFDGAGDWVTLSNSPLLNFSTNLTVQAWVYPATLSGWRTVLLKERPAGLSYALYADNNASRPGMYGNNGGGSSLSALGTAPLPLNTWTHLAGTYSNGVLRLYTNGLLAGTQTLGGSIVTTSNPLRIGGNSVWGEYFIGLIDEVRIHNRALTGSEIQELMAMPVAEEPGFTIVVYNNPVTIGRSDSGTYNLGIAPIGGFTSEVFPTVSGLPSDTTAAFEPPDGPPHPGPFALTITTGTTTPAGTYSLTVTCTNGSLSATTNLTLTVNTNADFRISVEPNGLIIAQGQVGIATFHVDAENGYAENVTLSASGLPSGASATFTPSALVPTGSGTVQFNVGALAPIGVYPVLLTATDGVLTNDTAFTLTIQEAGSGSWQQLSLGDPGVMYYGVIVGDVGGIGTNRVFGSAGSGLMYAYTYNGSSWSFSKMPVGVPSDGEMHNMDIGPARQDGVNRLYIAAAGSGRVYEMSWLGGSWQSNLVATLNGSTDIIIGNGRNDGVLRMYITWMTGTTEFTWNGSGWTQLTMSSNETGGWVHGIDLGAGRNDGTNRIYTANQGNGEVYEYTWDGVTWIKTFIGDIVDARNVEVGQGRNDGQSRVYVAGGDGDVFEFTWTGSAWQGISMGNAGISSVKVQSIPAKARSDDLVRIYVAASSGVYEYDWTGSAWQTAHLGDAVAYMYGLAVGDGLNKGTTQVYGSSYDGNVYLFEWISTNTSVVVPDVVGQTQASATAAITNAGLTLGLVTSVSSTTVPPGSVISQNPVGGTQVAPGSAVSLVVSSGSAPVITSVVALDGNLTFSGTNGSGTAGGSFYVCSSTNVAAPLASWVRESTNTYGSGGTFSVTNAIIPDTPQKFYVLDQP